MQNLVGMDIFKTTPVVLPPPPEQRAIAAALSDVDGLITALDRLIAKKRAIKQATMQQLLTGKTRLPGFGGEWETKRLGDFGITYGGLSSKSKSDFGSGEARYIPFLNVLENVIIDYSQLEHVQVAANEAQNLVQEGDVLFNGTSETPGDLAMGAAVKSYSPNLYLNSFCFGFRIYDHTKYSNLFLAYFFRGPEGRRLMYALAQGATRYNLSKKQFMSLVLVLPEVDEQAAIAAVLSDMDAEIAALEQRRDKTQAIKQGMMQQLLTGRIRLTNEEVNV
jgi:type I restriction enzyme S subunit